MHNEKVKKVYMDSYAKLDPLMKKHGIKIVGAWTSMPDHLTVMVCEAPNMEAFMKFSMEPEAMMWASYNDSEIRVVMTLEESMKMMK